MYIRSVNLGVDLEGNTPPYLVHNRAGTGQVAVSGNTYTCDVDKTYLALAITVYDNQSIMYAIIQDNALVVKNNSLAPFINYNTDTHQISFTGNVQGGYWDCQVWYIGK